MLVKKVTRKTELKLLSFVREQFHMGQCFLQYHLRERINSKFVVKEPFLKKKKVM